MDTVKILAVVNKDVCRWVWIPADIQGNADALIERARFIDANTYSGNMGGVLASDLWILARQRLRERGERVPDWIHHRIG